MPTGIVVQCQNERSQHMNKDKAMQMLKAKLYLLKQQEAEAKLSGIRGEVTDIGWGNQIRSYVMQPYTMVKDHRTNEETGNVDAVLDGDIDPFSPSDPAHAADTVPFRRFSHLFLLQTALQYGNYPRRRCCTRVP